MLCGAKLATEFESWEEPFDSLEACCIAKFSYDIKGCCESEGMGGCGGSGNDEPPPLRYFATWKQGKLCESKRVFEDWEQPFDSLQDCCNEKFSYDYEACCQSNGQGGCV